MTGKVGVTAVVLVIWLSTITVGAYEKRDIDRSTRARGHSKDERGKDAVACEGKRVIRDADAFPYSLDGDGRYGHLLNNRLRRCRNDRTFNDGTLWSTGTFARRLFR